MLRNYLTIALRTLRRNAGYTAINLIGLAVGLAACLLIGLYVRHELSYDTFHEKSDRIYRVVQHAQRGEESRSRLIHSARLAPAVDANLPSVEQAVRISQRWGEEILVKRGEHTFYEGNFYLADSTFFDVFGFSLRRGNPETVLTEPFSVVLTERMAEKYFGKTNPIGKTIRAEGYGQMHELTVTGVAENPPSTTHLPFDFLVSFNTLRQTMPDPEDLDSWRHTAHYTYLLLEEEAQPAALERTLPKFVFRQQGRSLEELEEKGGSLSHDELQPITDIHLHSHYDRELTANSDVRYVYLFVTLALLILGLACVNYVNLATAQATRRAREVGVRKTVGAHRRQLVRQYLGESALLCAVALVGALVLARLALPVFNDLVGVQLGAHFFGPTTLLLVLGLGFVVAVGAGAYPAFYLSAFQPVEVIEGQIGTGSGRTPLRKGLVVLQFAVAVGLIAGTVGGDDSEGRAAGADGFRVAGGQSYAPDGGDYAVPGDFSSMSYLLAAGALAADDGLIIEGARPSAQGDAVIVDVLGRMGADIAWDREAGRVRVAASSLEGVEVGVADTPDLLPTIAVLGAAAAGTTRITDCEHVRLKETDRVAAMATELERMGVDVEERTNELVVDGGGLEGATVSGHADHRIVMALSVAGVVADGETTVAGADHVDVSFPAFFETLSALGAAVERPS